MQDREGGVNGEFTTRPLERLSQLTLPRSDLCFPSAPSLFSFRQTGAISDGTALAHPPARFESCRFFQQRVEPGVEASPSPLPLPLLSVFENNNNLK